MSQIFYKIVDTRTGVTAYVPDYAWKRTRKLYQVMDIGDLAFMERADDEFYIQTAQGYIPEDEAPEPPENDFLDEPIGALTVGELMALVTEGCRRGVIQADAEYEAQDLGDEPPGPGEPYAPHQIKG